MGRWTTGTVAACALLGVGVAGCSTEPATKVMTSSAQLNGTLGNPLKDQTLDYHFEYVPSVAPYEAATSVGSGSLAAGTESKAVSAGVGGLSPATQYKVRICGAFQPSGNSGCLPEKLFTTATPANGEDIVSVAANTRIGATIAFEPLLISAETGPQGQGLTGTIAGSLYAGSDKVPITGRLTCVAVRGHEATVNFTSGGTQRTTLFLTDNGGSTPDVIAFSPDVLTEPPGRALTDCGPARPGDPTLVLPVTAGRVVIADR